MDGVARPDVGRVRPIDTTGAFGRPKKMPSEGITAILVRGAINRSVGRPLARSLVELSTLEPWWLMW